MRPTFLFSIVFIAAIIMAASFGLHIQSLDPLYNLPPDVAANALYVCPAANPAFDNVSKGLLPFLNQINMVFFFALILLVFAWCWALYQNLLKDEFKADKFKQPWWWTKAIFWVFAIVLILVWTPNNYRNVHIVGAEGNWILCDDNTPGALPVKASSVKR
ncbi:MAG: hypothetical protein LBJ18_01585 [Rickettsiales bacterium]|jgi:SNF family Na+-dependent transporter|nr:hypothetical protein [Rickettsiales bacterium]